MYFLPATRSKDEAIQAIYADTYMWMRGRFDRDEFLETDDMP
ncbi:hypothetical protein T458_28035 [Brevibacillus panacihumi W25]|uniref:Uncharacterized protein n=1 Tax=Brevibacillus panacihumi W25 TaxID=1408254 RepID=V6MA63_9BACL|nr:hypothetical protein [Brevibacillus panacihumi]EST52243.1 hypothetical protein T458_28035 [Brevibacillus panacihumi W25]